MNIALPEALREFVDAEVKRGAYASPQDLIEAAVARLMLDPEPFIDDETIVSLEEAELELDRGEDLALEDVFEQLRAKYRQR